MRAESLEPRRLLSTVDLDPAFGGDGRVITDFGPRAGEHANAVAVQSDGKVLVAGSMDKNSTDAIVIQQNGNLNLAQSMVEQLAGDSNLIGVRGRATLNRPFTVVKQMEERAQESYRSKISQLEASLSETQQKLNELQRTKEKGQQRFILSPEQQQELAKFRQKEAEAKRELKQVRKNLRRDVDSLENRLKWVNIAAMPLVVSGSGIALAAYKRRRTAAK